MAVCLADPHQQREGVLLSLDMRVSVRRHHFWRLLTHLDGRLVMVLVEHVSRAAT